MARSPPSMNGRRVSGNRDATERLPKYQKALYIAQSTPKLNASNWLETRREERVDTAAPTSAIGSSRQRVVRSSEIDDGPRGREFKTEFRLARCPDRP